MNWKLKKISKLQFNLFTSATIPFNLISSCLFIFTILTFILKHELLQEKFINSYGKSIIFLLWINILRLKKLLVKLKSIIQLKNSNFYFKYYAILVEKWMIFITTAKPVQFQKKRFVFKIPFFRRGYLLSKGCLRK